MDASHVVAWEKATDARVTESNKLLEIIQSSDALLPVQASRFLKKVKEIVQLCSQIEGSMRQEGEELKKDLVEFKDKAEGLMKSTKEVLEVPPFRGFAN